MNVIIIVVSLVVIITITITVIFAIRQLRNFIHRRKQVHAMTEAISEYSNRNAENLPHYDPKLIKLAEVIGKGNFGVVYKATLEPAMETYAVKMVKTESFIEAAREAKIHYNLSHDNIVGIHGLSFCGDRTLLILQYMEFGSLKEFLEKSETPPLAGYVRLRGRRVLTVRYLLDMSQQIACGLAFLASTDVVHRDLSARNCLVSFRTSGASPYIVKISDFGLSRRLFSSAHYINSGLHDLPVLLAPECLRTNKYTHQSDVWSFGITMWEVFSFGKKPYGAIPNHVILRNITAGLFPEKPDLCPDEVYVYMKSCSALDPITRPTATAAESYLRLKVDEFQGKEYEDDNKESENEDDLNEIIVVRPAKGLIKRQSSSHLSTTASCWIVFIVDSLCAKKEPLAIEDLWQNEKLLRKYFETRDELLDFIQQLPHIFQFVGFGRSTFQRRNQRDRDLFEKLKGNLVGQLPIALLKGRIHAIDPEYLQERYDSRGMRAVEQFLADYHALFEITEMEQSKVKQQMVELKEILVPRKIRQWSVEVVDD